MYEESGVKIKSLRIKPFLDIQKRRIPSFEGSIGYIGPLEPKGSPPSIKLDLTQNEEVLDSPHLCQIFHQYSDYEEQIFKAKTYSFEEIFAEKTRALYQRCRPRDLYDVINIYKARGAFDFEENTYFKILRKKFEFKEMDLQEALNKELERLEVINEWNNMLEHQINDLPPVDFYLTQFDKTVLPWLMQGANQ